jgi:stage V sporulation protein S
LENVRMDRFFSKLDLRDIKIKPEGSRFLPDDDEVAVNDEPVAAPVSIEEASIEETSIELVEELDATTYDVPDGNGHIVSATYERIEVETWQASAPAVQRDRPRSADLGDGDPEVLKVSAKSRPSAVAGAIAGVVRENGRAEVQAIGAGATNQAIKAIAIAREYLFETDIDAICIPAFIDVTIDNEERTAIRLVIEKR